MMNKPGGKIDYPNPAAEAEQESTMTYLIDLECSQCGKSYPADQIQTYCQECQSPLLPRYDLKSLGKQLDRRDFSYREMGLWRWRELLPVNKPEYIITLGEGDTPLLRVENLAGQLGLDNLYVKDEGLNPTGTFKARGLTTAVSKALELGIKKIAIPTAGNAGGAMAAYAARGNLSASVVMPSDTPQANISECRAFGAQVELVDGLISDAAKLVAEKVSWEGWFDMSTFKEPYRVEGKKVMGLELAEAFDWELPEVIVYPTGGGTGLVGMWKAFQELMALGWIPYGRLPRFVAVQSEGCAPIVKAFHSGAETSRFWENAKTYASGIRVPKSFADRLILYILRSSEGIAVSVSDREIRGAQVNLAQKEGIFAAPEGAATLPGLIKLIEKGWIDAKERIVLFNTGSGLKYV
jgi:threonine synthase